MREYLAFFTLAAAITHAFETLALPALPLFVAVLFLPAG